jgi:ribulose-phosphate 3-epimerase
MSATDLAPAATRRGLISSIHVAPSILAADFSRLGDQVREVLDAGARVIHCDVMDGHFVPPITLGPLVVSALGDLVHDAGGILDVHLMIERPERQIEAFARAGADTITIHLEATPHVHYALAAIHDSGCLAGLALNPSTPAELIVSVTDALDLALCMTVNPGWGGQRFIDAARPKIARLRELLPVECALEVDGGIDVETAPECATLGANLLVAGSAVFGHADPGAAYVGLASRAARS